MGCEVFGFVDKKVMRYDDSNSWHYMQVAGIAGFQKKQNKNYRLN